MFVAILLAFASVSKAGVVLIDGTAADSIITTGTSWALRDQTTYPNSSTFDKNLTAEQALFGGGEILYADQTWNLNMPMPLKITYSSGALLQAMTDGVAVGGGVFVSQSFNTLKFELYISTTSGGGVGLSSLVFNGKSIAGTWNVIAVPGNQNQLMTFYVSGFDTLTSVETNLTFYPSALGQLPDGQQVKLTISGVQVVPEPSTIVILLFSSSLLLLKKKWKS